MSDELLTRAARVICDLRKIAKVLCDSGYPGAAIRLQGYAGYVRSLGPELDVANKKIEASSQLEERNATIPHDADRISLRTPSNGVLRKSGRDGNSQGRRQGGRTPK